MKKIIYGLVVLVLCFVVNNTSAQVAQIGYGTQAPLTNGAIYSPICKFSGTGNPFSRSNVLYTSSELNTEGITAGAVISKLSFYKIGTGASTSPSSLKIYLRNSTTTAPLVVGTPWSDIVASHTLCYSNTSQTISSATGWVEFILDNPFTYTGQNLEIAFDSDFTGSGSSGSFDWQYTPGFSDYILGYVSSSAGTGLTGTVVNYKQRANIKISYTPGSPCTVPPVSGNVTSSKLSATLTDHRADINRPTKTRQHTDRHFRHDNRHFCIFIFPNAQKK
ncbi:MAG: hypothetical protein H3C45_10510 [Bacteroidia bacterium]|nr:hypothetical protein [Bacteroidia bacterium]